MMRNVARTLMIIGLAMTITQGAIANYFGFKDSGDKAEVAQIPYIGRPFTDQTHELPSVAYTETVYGVYPGLSFYPSIGTTAVEMQYMPYRDETLKPPFDMAAAVESVETTPANPTAIAWVYADGATTVHTIEVAPTTDTIVTLIYTDVTPPPAQDYKVSFAATSEYGDLHIRINNFSALTPTWESYTEGMVAGFTYPETATSGTIEFELEMITTSVPTDITYSDGFSSFTVPSQNMTVYLGYKEKAKYYVSVNAVDETEQLIVPVRVTISLDGVVELNESVSTPSVYHVYYDRRVSIECDDQASVGDKEYQFVEAIKIP